MKNTCSIVLTLVFALLVVLEANAQTPSDAIMMKQRESCIGVVYDYQWFDEYWEGTYLRTNGTIETVKRQSVNPMIAIGLHDRLNLLVGVPWVKTESTEPNGGYFEGAEGWQDISIALKGDIVHKETDKGTLQFLTTVAYSTPISDYLSDYRPYSIGFGADEFTLRGIFQYKWSSGWYGRGALAYLWRGTTEAERDYYYNDGSYYSATMDVPNAWNFNVVAGKWLFDYTLQVEASFNGLHSTSGDDIRAYNAAQPTNKVVADDVRFLAHYYFKRPKGLGVLAYYMITVNGRNVGKNSGVGIGLTYVFKV